jgi:CSLREA domain-containing protein
MSLSSWFHSRSSWVWANRGAVPRKAQPRRVRRLRPALERLEDRTVPATILVNTFADLVDPNDGLTSLREAIVLAADPATHAGDDTIVLPHEIGGVARTYALSLGQLVIDDATGKLTILSDGGSATIDAQKASRVSFVSPGSEVEFQGLTITGGSDLAGGGGILNHGTLTLTGSTLSGNRATYYGGGILNFGTATVAACTLDGNSADYGGGIADFGAVTLTVTGSTLSGNSTRSFGGGIWNGGTATITASALSGNSATHGGGIRNDAMATVADCTLSGNSARGFGGGIGNVGFTFGDEPPPFISLTVTRSTLSGNSAEVSGGGISSFGLTGTLTVLTVTASNLSSNTGEGVYVEGGISAQLLGNTITGNSNTGVLVTSTDGTSSSNYLIGSPLTGNTIAFNGGAGVAVVGPSAGVAIRGNVIYGNAGPGIDLGNDGLTANDPGDADGGPNHLQNLPVLVLARSDAAGTSISGTLNSAAATRFLIDFYATPLAGSPPGMTYLGSALVRTDGGNVDFEVTLPTPVAAGWGITATATTTDVAPFGDTSEFALGIPVFAIAPPNRPPVVANQSFAVNENSANGRLLGTVVASDPDAGQTLSYQITAGNTSGAFALDARTGRLSAANSAALDFETTPVFTLTVQVTDSGSPTLSGTASVTIRLMDVNEPPVNHVPTYPQSVVKNQTLTFSRANGNAIWVSDPDATTTLVQVSLTVLHGTLTLACTAGLTFQVGDGKSDGTMTFRGTIAAVNAALDGLTYKPKSGYVGTDSLTITTNDLGSGLGDPLADTDVIAILVQETKKGK